MAESIERYFLLMPINRRMRPSQRLWCPAADVYRTGDGWIVKVDLAGVNADDVEVSLSDRTLVISGVRRDTSCSEGVTYQLEITYSRFEKSIRFPCNIEDAHLARDYRDGLLILHLRGEDCE
ncbi:MAG TPA: Hsp20/alpha crystallin family protein [Pyrinomonadaceae bacterium]|nr:Hsp20/alpha crystallin family protein [Pyrinomonadaceae bacterium]